MTQELKLLLESVIKSGYQLSPDTLTPLKRMSFEEVKTLIYKALQKANTDQEERIILNWAFFQSVEDNLQKKRKGVPNDAVPLAKTFETSFEIIPPGDPEPTSHI